MEPLARWYSAKLAAPLLVLLRGAGGQPTATAAALLLESCDAGESGTAQLVCEIWTACNPEPEPDLDPASATAAPLLLRLHVRSAAPRRPAGKSRAVHGGEGASR